MKILQRREDVRVLRSVYITALALAVVINVAGER